MNTINEICIYAIQLYNTNKVRFIKRIIIKSKISKLKNILYMQDIFSLSNNIITFFNSIPRYIINTIGLNIDQELIQMNLYGSINITYNAKRQEFEIYDKTYGAYAVSKHITVPKTRKEKWLDTEYALKKFYIDSLIDITKILAKERVIKDE